MRCLGFYLSRILLGVLPVLIMAVAVMAAPHEVVLLPDGTQSSPGELDTTWPDSIYYFNPLENLTIYTDRNMWSGTRFTPPGDFTLQGIRFRAYNSNNNEDQCEVYVYSDNQGRPGDDLYGQPVWDAPLPNGVTWVEIVLVEGQEREFAAGEDFWIMYGPAPGGPYPGEGWWNLVDQAVTAGRSKMSTSGRNGNWNITLGGDLFITAEGEMGDFFDLAVLSVYNDDDRFFLLPDDIVQLDARIVNTGNIPSPDGGMVEFNVSDRFGNEVFGSEEALLSLEPGEETIVTAFDVWQSLTLGRNIARATLVLDEDPIEDNNHEVLMQTVFETGNWYRYDDNTFESRSSFTAGNGWAQAFRPVSYPARIDSATWYFSDSNDSTDIRVWRMDAGAIEEIWSYTGPIQRGWNTFAIMDPDSVENYLFDSGDFALAYVWTENSPLSKDDNIPISAQNRDMHVVSYQLSNYGENAANSASGNWSMRLLISAEQNPPHHFGLSFPYDGRMYPLPEMNLGWETAADPDPWDEVTYDLYVTTDPDSLGDPAVRELTETTFTYVGEENTVYWWTVSASDGVFDPVFADETWSFTINWPEPPDSFNLLQPQDGEYFMYEETFPITFSWEESSDPDPGETVTYRVDFFIHPLVGADTLLVYGNLDTTALTINLLDTLGVPFQENYLDVEWWAEAVSGRDAVESNQHWHIFLDRIIENVGGEFEPIPRAFSIGSPYPNPFNSTVTVPLALPRSGKVVFTLYDLLGREVHSDVRRFDAGRYRFALETSSMGNNPVSGLYFLQVRYEDRVSTRKLLLLR